MAQVQGRPQSQWPRAHALRPRAHRSGQIHPAAPAVIALRGLRRRNLQARPRRPGSDPRCSDIGAGGTGSLKPAPSLLRSPLGEVSNQPRLPARPANSSLFSLPDLQIITGLWRTMEITRDQKNGRAIILPASYQLYPTSTVSEPLLRPSLLGSGA